MKALPELEKLLAYRHPQVVAAYRRNHPQTADQAEQLFEDMIRFLWLSSKHARDLQVSPDDESLRFLLVMHEEMREIDNMWHAFILYTQDYTNFCESSFGEYFHHQPDIAQTNPQAPAEFQEDLEKFLSYAYDHLGEQTVRRWFAMHLDDAAAS